ncbi:restriction endonuclease subunit S [Mucilaginibacter psychrotolerans]|uniref:Type I restriction modification DNA specificity domain-containing protein n=1 Tax=Mucilaginibacter psychrotolerans TaxID=1524096 RepID=A0A4Y8SKI5_9SPHI|nr:restriction endonuclease subunit S [Mucilaginibacter psychrotolerans]TFF39195.1 hypothetical protein E2R66_06125 [Mucilaginibacter psychrotolerans]
MKINYADYIKNADASVLVAEAIFSELELTYPIKYISEVAKTTSGGTPLRSNPDYYNGDVPWIKSGELNDGIIENAEEFITQKGLANSSAKLHPPNTLLLAMYGATAGRTGKAKIASSTNQAVCALFPKEEIEQDYLFWFLRQYRHKFIEISKGGAQPNISQSVINLTKLPVPSKDLQLQIVQFLFELEANKDIDFSKVPIQFRAKVTKVFTAKNNVFKISDEITHQLHLVKKLRRQLLQNAVQGKLVAQNPDDEHASILLQKIKAEKEQLIKDKKLKKEKELPPIKPEEIPFDIPENWVWCRLGEITSTISNGLYKPEHFYQQSGYISLRMFNIQHGQIDLKKVRRVVLNEQELDTYLLEENDILVNRVNSLELVGKSAIIKNIGEPAVFESMNMRLRLLLKDQMAQFVNQILLEERTRVYFYSNAKVANGQVSINQSQLFHLLIPLPPLAEQRRIIEKLNQLMKTCDALEASIKQSQLQNQQLLQQVLREALTKEAEPVAVA